MRKLTLGFNDIVKEFPDGFLWAEWTEFLFFHDAILSTATCRTAHPVDDTPILNAPWPPDLDPADVPFRTRSVTILRRMGYFDDPSQFNTLTETEVLSWWNAGEPTVADIRATGNAAIERHHEQAAQGQPPASHLCSLVVSP